MTPQFTSNQNKGFTMTFQNGLTISVQFGTMNYCSRKSIHASYRSEMHQDTVQSRTAEIAIWDETDTWFDFGYDTVEGHCDTNEVARWIGIVSNAENMKHLQTIVGKK